MKKYERACTKIKYLNGNEFLKEIEKIKFARIVNIERTMPNAADSRMQALVHYEREIL